MSGRHSAPQLPEGDPLAHPLLASLGPEPFDDGFDVDALRRGCAQRRVAIKQVLMDQRVVVGVGNIYASESLFLAGIHPKRAAGRIALARYEKLADSIKAVLERAIRAGGTTLRDFYGGNGEAGYFQQELDVYGRAGEPCKVCNTPITSVVLGQRATFYCKNCQT